MSIRFNTTTVLLYQVVLLSLCCSALTGQQRLEINGYIVDAENGQPVPYASVGVIQQQLGISANLNGYFSLLLNDSNATHTLEISSIGYNKATVSFSEITWGQELSISLVPKPTVLSEVVIRGRSLTLEEMIASTSKKRKVYLRSKPYLMNVLYRETSTKGEKYGGFTEAQGIFYVSGYNSRYKNHRNQVLTFDLAQWKHIRRNTYPTAGYLRIGKILKAKDYYLHEGPLSKGNLDKFVYTIEDSTQYNEQLVLKIAFKPKAPYQNEFDYEGSMLIKEGDQALLGLDVVHRGAEPFLKQKQNQIPKKSIFSISFLLFNGQYYLNRSSFVQTLSSNEGDFEHSMEIIGGRFTNQEPEFMNTAQRTVLYSEMLNPLINYDHDFWANFKMADSTDLKRIKDQNSNLENEFQQNHQLRLVPLPEGFQNYQQMVEDQDILDFFMQY